MKIQAVVNHVNVQVAIVHLANVNEKKTQPFFLSFHLYLPTLSNKNKHLRNTFLLRSSFEADTWCFLHLFSASAPPDVMFAYDNGGERSVFCIPSIYDDVRYFL